MTRPVTSTIVATNGAEALAGSLGARIVLTVWLVYALHATTNVVRETYLSVAIGDRFSLREWTPLNGQIFLPDFPQPFRRVLAS